MERQHRPVPLKDLAEEYASANKSADAWLTEFTRARKAGKLTILKPSGNRFGNNYSTRFHVDRYIRETYQAEVRHG